jgi:hypothetical protein
LARRLARGDGRKPRPAESLSFHVCAVSAVE